MSGPASSQPWVRRMSGRDPREKSRPSTPLELLFDLTYIVAVARAALELRDDLVQGHPAHALAGYCIVFYGLWWAWVNSTWFASAYDTDDVPYRLLTLLQMAGVLIYSAGIPAGFATHDFVVVVGGYVVMRLSLVAQVLRAAGGHPEGRVPALRYAAGAGAIQLGWIGWLSLTGSTRMAVLAVLLATELAVQAWARHGDQGTPWHPGHIAERYGEFTIIVLGEVISAVAVTASTAVTDKKASPGLLIIATSGLLLVFGLWWSYFRRDSVQDIRHELKESVRRTFLRSIAHFLIFASVAALGAGLQIAIQPLTHGTRVTQDSAAFAVAIPVAVYVLVLALLDASDAAKVGIPWLSLLISALLLGAAGATPLITLPAATVTMVVLVVGLLVYYLSRDKTPLTQEAG